MAMNRAVLPPPSRHARRVPHEPFRKALVGQPSRLPGTSADVELILDSRDDTLRIPASAVAEGGKVLILKDGLLEERTIDVGLRNWRFAEVLGGLDLGERVVVARNSPDIKVGARAEERAK